MSDSLNRNTRLYRSLVCNVVNSLRETPWTPSEVEELFKGKPELPYGTAQPGVLFDGLGITFVLTWVGLVEVQAAEWEWVQGEWRYAHDLPQSWQFASDQTGFKLPGKRCMQIGKLQHAFTEFMREYSSRCSRTMQDHRRGKLYPRMGGAEYFGDVCVKEYLEHPITTITLLSGEIRINDQIYRSSRGWRRDVRGTVGLASS